MATPPPPPAPQRAYRAACPNCGAPVEFRSAASAFAVCSYCRSTIVRDGEALRRIGRSAELFDDHSPLRLGAAGRYQGRPFVLVGRVQRRYAEGTWNEWHALFEDDRGARSGWLSEDNGRYVFAFDEPLAEAAPIPAKLQPGAMLTLAGRRWSVASVTPATLLAVEGELPAAPVAPEREAAIVDVRNTAGEVGTLDYADPARPLWSVGRSVALSELAMTGLADASEKTLAARGIECPSCGSALEPQLATTQSIVCPQCKAVVDLSQGVGADLAYYAQEQGTVEPQIPLGRSGTLALGGAPLPWTVVGYVERCEIPQDAEDEQVFWREYLLYHRTAGFAFLVDADEGWSWVMPLTGAPEGGGAVVRWQGDAYRKLYDYQAKVTYVLGEFYWKLERDAVSDNTDYQGSGAADAKRLNRERSGTELVWSGGETLDADLVAQAFGLAGRGAAAPRRDATPVGGSAAGLLGKLFFWMFLAAVVFLMFRCDAQDERCDELRATYGDASTQVQNCLRARSSGAGGRTSGGSFGGFSSGGGHK